MSVVCGQYGKSESGVYSGIRSSVGELMTGSEGMIRASLM